MDRPLIPRRLVWLAALLAAVFAGLFLLGQWVTAGTGTVSGLVIDQGGPVAGASVRVRATNNSTHSDQEGRFSLTKLTEGEEIEITAWQSGYYVAGKKVTPTTVGLVLTLRPYHTVDHPTYDWTSPISGTSPAACGRCHPQIMTQWSANAHGQAIDNPRFFSLYSGTDISSTTPVLPGYVQDFPGTAGNCASCHAPGAGVDGYLSTSMTDVRGVVTAGIHCDFCHKVAAVYLDPSTGSVYANAPGVNGQRILRPPPSDDIFFGPYDDVPDPDTFAPIFSASQYCAPCHQTSFWGTPIYSSFEEWQNSAYAAEGITCQDCHMPPSGDIFFALQEVGGRPHPPDSIPSHWQLGATSEELLQDTVAMNLDAHQVGSTLRVQVRLTNTGAGHHVPTDYPGRHLILTVDVSESGGGSLPQTGGTKVPFWGGAEAGQAGEILAKLLQDARTGNFPIVNYWAPAVIRGDNRLAADESRLMVYDFVAPSPHSSAVVTVTAALSLRRNFQADMDARAWSVPDVPMEQATTTVVVHPWWATYLPLVDR